MSVVDPQSEHLLDERLDDLVALIKDSFRVRENHDPVYVEVPDPLSRVAAKQHQVIFGRRGSGKSCLLIHFHRSIDSQDEVSVYVSADEIKTLSYPDVLIRLLLTIFTSLPGSERTLIGRLLRRQAPLEGHITALQNLLDKAAVSDVTEAQELEDSRSLGASAGPQGSTVDAHWSQSQAESRTSSFREEKLDHLERHLADHKDAIREALQQASLKKGAIILDDFYLIHPTVQPDVIDYVHRLLRGTDFYFKVGTVRHRTVLARQNGRTIGIELYQDVESLDLDQTFEDTEATHGYLSRMLDSMGQRVGIEDASRFYLSNDGLLALTLASGGVPRDYLTIFVEAVSSARERRQTKWLTPTSVYKGACRLQYRTKLNQLRGDVGPDAGTLEPVLQDLLTYCLTEKRKTAFLVSQDDAQAVPAAHEIIHQLMDFKLIHVIEADTSAASGRAGRYEAYTLDFAFFMEPRLRAIEHVEFWEKDDQRRRKGLREAPVYELRRVESIASDATGRSTESVVDDLVDSIGADEVGDDGEPCPPERSG